MAVQVFTENNRETVLWNSTELITPNDLNAMQRLEERRHWDEYFRYCNNIHSQAMPVGSSFGVSVFGGSGMVLSIRAGSLLWDLAVDPGTPDVKLLRHKYAGQVLTVDAADPTNDRIDILSYKVEVDALNVASADAESRASRDAAGVISAQTFDKRRRTKLTLTYTPGTPAGSPVAPAVPSGEVKFAEIYVEAATTDLEGFVTDYRTPAGMTVLNLSVMDYRLPSASPATIATSNPYQLNLSSTGNIYYSINPPVSGKVAFSGMDVFRCDLRVKSIILSTKSNGFDNNHFQLFLDPSGLEEQAFAIAAATLSTTIVDANNVPATPAWVGSSLKNPAQPNKRVDLATYYNHALTIKIQTLDIGTVITGIQVIYYGE